MRSRAALSWVLTVFSLACAAPAPPVRAVSSDPPEPRALSSTSASTAPPPAAASTGPLLAGILAAAITDEGGSVYDAKDTVDLHALEACYQGYLATPVTPGTPRAGLPGWARFRLQTNDDQRTVTPTPLDHSGLPPPLSACLANALTKAPWSPGPRLKQVYLSLR